jgi:pimeloyl-ACP methyl ester carboxylesterase
MHRRNLLKTGASVLAGTGLLTAGFRAESANERTHPLPRPYIETADGAALFYKDWGAGSPVVFLAGWGLSSDMWEYQMPYLVDQGLRCIAYDRRGHGRSDQPGRGYDYNTLADDLAALIEQLALRGVTLIAHSMGSGEVARNLTAHGTDRITRVILMAPITPFLLKTADHPEGVPKEAFDAALADLSSDRPRYLAENAPAFFGAGLPGFSVSPEMIQWGIRMALQASPKAAIDTFRMFTTADLRPDMRAFTVPTLIVHGDADQSAPLDLTGRKTAQAIPGSHLTVYEGAPHGLFITHRDRLNSDLLAFIRG